jgi:hypothetical protein
MTSYSGFWGRVRWGCSDIDRNGSNGYFNIVTKHYRQGEVNAHDIFAKGWNG